MTDCLARVPYICQTCLPLNVFQHSFAPSLPLARPGNKQSHREDKTHSVISQMLMDSRLFSPSAAAPLHSPTPYFPLNIINLSSTHRYPVMTFPFQFIPALSLLLPWPSFWNSRKQATSPPLLPSRSVSLRQQVVCPPAAHPQALCFSLEASSLTRQPRRPAPPT